MEQVQQRGRSGFLRGFIEHPASVNETYFQHMRFAAGFATALFGAALAALIHAIIPPLFETTASRLIRKLHARMEARH
jgi:hypothetical protein